MNRKSSEVNANRQGHTVSESLFGVVKTIALVCIFALTACGQQGQESEAEATPTPLPTPIVPEKPEYTVGRGTVVKTLEFTGRVSPVMEQELFFRSDGFVSEVYTSRSDEVRAGDVLAELEISDLEAQLEEAQLALQTTELNLSKAQQDNEDALAEAQIQLESTKLRKQQGVAGGASASVTSAEINLSRAQDALTYAQDEYAKALDRDWEPQEVVDSYAEQVQRAEQDLEIAQAQYNEALGGQSVKWYDRQLLDYDLQLAELKVETLERGIDPLLALEVEKAKLNIKKLEAQIADAQLIAPFDGVVLSLDLKAGDAAQAYDAVMALADPNGLEISADLSSDDLNEMSVGQLASIQLRNRPEEDLSGSVRQLPAAYSGSAISSEDDDKVRIAFDNVEDVELEIGELANVIIVLEEKVDVLWLSVAAIRSFQGRDFVVVKEADGQRRVDLLLGISSDERVEIKSGLEEGWTIVGE